MGKDKHKEHHVHHNFSKEIEYAILFIAVIIGLVGLKFMGGSTLGEATGAVTGESDNVVCDSVCVDGCGCKPVVEDCNIHCMFEDDDGVTQDYGCKKTDDGDQISPLVSSPLSPGEYMAEKTALKEECEAANAVIIEEYDAGEGIACKEACDAECCAVDDFMSEYE